MKKLITIIFAMFLTLNAFAENKYIGKYIEMKDSEYLNNKANYKSMEITEKYVILTTAKGKVKKLNYTYNEVFDKLIGNGFEVFFIHNDTIINGKKTYKIDVFKYTEIVYVPYTDYVGKIKNAFVQDFQRPYDVPEYVESFQEKRDKMSAWESFIDFLTAGNKY